MARRGRPDLSGAPMPSATSRPAGTGGLQARPGGPNRWKDGSKNERASSGTARSTGPEHRRPLATARMAGEGIGPDLKDSWRLQGDKGFAGSPPRASQNTDARVNVQVNEQGNRHGGNDIAGAPPLAR